MTVKDFFSIMEGKDKINVDIIDVISNTCINLTSRDIWSDDDCYTEWKNSVVLSWRVYSSKEIYLRVKKQK